MTAMTGRFSTIHPERVAVFLPSWVGDTVMATPALRALRVRFNSSWIALFGRPGPLDILAGADVADTTLIDPSARPAWGPLGLGRAARQLSGLRFDLAVLLPNSFRSALVAALAGVPDRLGYIRDGRGWLLTAGLTPPRAPDGSKTYPTLDYYLELAAELGATTEDRQMRLSVDAHAREQTEQLLAAAGRDAARPLVVLNPGGSFGPSKLWPAERYAAVADTLNERHGAQIIINAAPGETRVAHAVAGAMKHPPLINLADEANSLGLVKGLLAAAALLVTNDTGARHIGAAVGTGLVTVFGSTDPARTIIDYERERIVRASVPCSPCQKKRCPNPRGPTFHQCMLAIEPDDVITAAESLLTQEARP